MTEKKKFLESLTERAGLNKPAMKVHLQWNCEPFVKSSQSFQTAHGSSQTFHRGVVQHILHHLCSNPLKQY